MSRTRKPTSKVDGESLFWGTADEILRRFYFENPDYAYVVTLWVAMAWTHHRFEALFHLGIQGPKGSGKTKLLEFLSRICPNPIGGANASASAIARAVDRGGSLFIDELDELPEETRDLVMGILRVGYRSGPLGDYIRTDRNTMKEIRTHTFGPKAFTYRGGVEDALADRTLPAVLSPAPSSEKKRVALRNKDVDLKWLEVRWREWARIAAPRMDPKKDIEDPDFNALLDASTTADASPRDIELLTVLLSCGRALGVDRDSLIRFSRFITTSHHALEETGDMEMLKSVLSGLATTEDAIRSGCVSMTVVRSLFNAMRKGVGDAAVGPFVFRRILRELRIPDDAIVRPWAGKDPTTGKDLGMGPRVILLTGKVLSILGL